jgi:hypothetical protein
MSVSWRKIGEGVWVLGREDSRVMYSIIIRRGEEDFVVLNAGLVAGERSTLRDAEIAAENYWRSQSVGPFAAEPVPVTGTAETVDNLRKRRKE